MTTEFLMEIGFLFKTGEKRIAGGIDSKYSVQDLNWIDFINKNIIIKTKNNDLLFKVKKVDLFPAISSRLNIGLTLYDYQQFDFLNVGDKVYKIAEEDSGAVEK